MNYKNIYEQRKDRIENYIQSKGYIPLKQDELATILDVPSDEINVFAQILDELIEEGHIVKTKRGRYMSLKSASMFRGTYTNTGKGFGFVFVEDGEDIYIPDELSNAALHTDEVLARVTETFYDGRRRGEIIKIIKRNLTEVIGTYTRVKRLGFVIPDNYKIGHHIFIDKDGLSRIEHGSRVVAKIIRWNKEMIKPLGVVTEVLGNVNDPNTNVLALIKQFELPLQFPSNCMAEAKSINDSVTDEDIIVRKDLRNEQIITIDGADAKDLDDAVCVKILENGNYELGVHIADVTHYVKENSQIDIEAIKRGTSVYLADRVIPMLPQKLSNGICSLHPSVDRLTLSCIMQIDKNGDVVSYEIVETVINTVARMTYDDVTDILEENNKELTEKYSSIIDMLLNMKKLSDVLRKKRQGRGSIDFDITECKIDVDGDGKVTDIKPYERNTAMNIIEDFMLLCNETIAENCFWLELPFIYRSHEVPDKEKIEILSKFILNFGYSLPYNNDVHPKALQQILETSVGQPFEHIVKRATLRALKQARYTEQNKGHFGLAAKYYCHFTSPIRRYPDLQIHRIIKENIHGMTRERIDSLNNKMSEVASKSSIQERVADEAEREVKKLKKAEYMMERIGEKFNGIVSGVTSWGIYVELPNTIEGMVSVYKLHPGYDYDGQNMEYVNEWDNRVIKIGQPVEIKVADVDLLKRTIDFDLLDRQQKQ